MIDVQASGLESVNWPDTVARMSWEQGEHVVLVGPTGVGKTELGIDLLLRRRWGVFFNTKRIDATQDLLLGHGFRRSRDGIINPQASARWIVSPPWTRKSFGRTDEVHREIYSRALIEAFWQTAWTCLIDELEYINKDLGIVKPVDKLLRQGRSQRNTMILGTQRPRNVTLHAFEQARHVFLWRQDDLENVKRAAELAGINRHEVMRIMPSLGKHDVLYVKKDAGQMFITNTRWE